MALENNIGIICLTETHLNYKVSDNELISDGWEIFRTDRKGRIMGGSAIILRSDFIVSKTFYLSNSYCDTV